MATKIAKIKIDRGLEADLPFGFELGRLYVTTDTHKLFAGQGVSSPLVEITGGGGGSTATAIVFTLVAGENINAYSACALHSDGFVYKADASNVADADRVIGVAITSALLGTSVSVQQVGEIDNAGFLFTPGESVYLGTSGALVQTPNAGAFELPLGTALSASKMEANIGTPIIFA